MFVVNEDLSIYATRGDIVFFSVSAQDDGMIYKFQPGDIVRMSVYGKKDAEEVVMQRDFPVEEVTESVFIFLSEEDTKFGEIISKHKDYWYEVVLNPDTMPQTIIGYDEDGAKIFRLFPESAEWDDDYHPQPEDFPVVDEELDMTSPRPVANSAIARTLASITATVGQTIDTRAAIATVIAADYKTNTRSWSEAINLAIEAVDNGKVVLPSGFLECDSPLILKSNICIEGQGIEGTTLHFTGCHGITVPRDSYLRFASVKNLSLVGDNNGDNSTYDNTKNGINLDAGVETYQCSVENVRITGFAGKGLYAPYDFNNLYRRVFVSMCGGHGIEVCGLNTCTLENCYVEYVNSGFCGYRIYGNAVMISCNGLGGGGDYWGIFGRNNGAFEDGNNGARQYNVTFLNCNIEDFEVSGCKFLYTGGFAFDNCTFYAKKEGTFEYYIEVADVTKCSSLERVVFESKGATTKNAAKIKCSTNTAKIASFTKGINKFTTDGTTVFNLPYMEFGVYDSYLQQALELGYVNIQGMSYFKLGSKKHSAADNIPTSGESQVGDIVYNKSPAPGGYVGWVCTNAGNPGTWKPFGLIAQ